MSNGFSNHLMARERIVSFDLSTEFITKQNNETITLQFTYQNSTAKFSKPLIMVNIQKSSICIKIWNKVALCGTLYGKIKDFRCFAKDSKYTIIFFKEEKGKWPIFIKGECDRGLDADSFIKIGEMLEKHFFAKRKYDNAIEWYKLHMNPIFVEKLRTKAIYLMNSYFTEKIKYGIQLFEITLHLNQPSEYEVYTVSEALFKVKDYKLAYQLLDSMTSQISINDSLIMEEYVKLLSPYQLNQIQERDIPKYKMCLNQLVNEMNPTAMRILSRHLKDGKFYNKDPKRAKQQIQEADRIDPMNSKAVIYSKYFVAVAGIGATIYAFYLYYNQKK